MVMHASTDFASGFSLEATRPKPGEIAKLQEILPSGTPVYVTAVPTAAPDETVIAASTLRRAGLEPVVHIAARRLASAQGLQNLLSRLAGEAGVRRLLVIGGDIDTMGPFPDALAVIQRARLRDFGIEEIGIGAYPEGHPRIAPDRLSASLDEKIASATAQGLRVHIISQFCFSGERIIAWLTQLRSVGISHPVRVGLAGPTSVTALIRFAKRCGVNASLRGLMSGTAAALVGNVGPDRLIEALAAAQDKIGDAHPHYFTFGNLLDTARYARGMAQKDFAGALAEAASN